ncbi:hypothetical protein BJV78DRAFT_1254928 [Lactifluus subvellereus]|nr:hypothetical protein BJV78DRAFT_1254928 [Lactifluus subvellereus]
MWLSGFLLIHGGMYALTTDPAKEIYSFLGVWDDHWSTRWNSPIKGPRFFHRGSQPDGLDDVWSRQAPRDRPSSCADTRSRYPTFPILYSDGLS